MSAYMCDDAHISALAAYAVGQGVWKPSAEDFRAFPNATDAEILARKLHKANALSLTARYGDPDDPPFEFDHAAAREARGNAGLGCAPVRVIKAAHCYRYQACEDRSWEGSEAERVTQAIIEHATHKLPGYDSAAWGW